MWQSILRLVALGGGLFYLSAKAYFLGDEAWFENYGETGWKLVLLKAKEWLLKAISIILLLAGACTIILIVFAVMKYS